MKNLKQKVKDFLSLPKIFNTPERRLRREITELKEVIEVVPCEDGYEDTNEGCCGKETFNSHDEAMSSIAAYHNKGKKPHRAYQCGNGNWHLTSMSLKVFNKLYKTNNKF